MAAATASTNAFLLVATRDQPFRRKASVNTRTELDSTAAYVSDHIIKYNKKLGGSHSSRRSMLHIFFIVSTVLATVLISTENHIIAQDKPGVCGLVMDSSNTEWRTYTQAEQNDIEKVAACLTKIGREDLSSLNKGEPTRKLYCPTDVTLETVRNTIKQYDTVWFGGDSIIEQQFFTLACMLDPSLPSLTDRSLFWHHPTNHSNNAKTGTTLQFSKFGWIFDHNEHDLFKGVFPKTIQRLGSNDAIVMDAYAHYDSSRLHLLANAVNHIAQMSTQAMASVFYMEPALKDWPTSNGLYTKQCMKRCRCEYVDKLRLMGRGNYSHPSTNRTADFSFKLPTPTDDWLLRLYPNGKYATDTESCLPDCLPATWRMDLARAILDETEHNLTLVPLFWQLHAKRAPSSRLPFGDCVHKSLDAVMMMNEQLSRSMEYQLHQRVI